MANAAILAASVILKVKKEIQQQMNIGQICDSLVDLLRADSSKNSGTGKEKNRESDRGSSHTRSRAAQALGLLASIRK